MCSCSVESKPRVIRHVIGWGAMRTRHQTMSWNVSLSVKVWFESCHHHITTVKHLPGVTISLRECNAPVRLLTAPGPNSRRMRRWQHPHGSYKLPDHMLPHESSANVRNAHLCNRMTLTYSRTVNSREKPLSSTRKHSEHSRTANSREKPLSNTREKSEHSRTSNSREKL